VKVGIIYVILCTELVHWNLNMPREMHLRKLNWSKKFPLIGGCQMYGLLVMSDVWAARDGPLVWHPLILASQKEPHLVAPSAHMCSHVIHLASTNPCITGKAGTQMVKMHDLFPPTFRQSGNCTCSMVGDTNLSLSGSNGRNKCTLLLARDRYCNSGYAVMGQKMYVDEWMSDV
jgi:hypothetical protein